VGCPRLVGKPRVASLLVGSRYEQQHGVGKKGLGKKDVKCTPLFYRE
jgi:hypothetical protein